jgi:hypothetical protein
VLLLAASAVAAAAAAAVLNRRGGGSNSSAFSANARAAAGAAMGGPAAGAPAPGGAGQCVLETLRPGDSTHYPVCSDVVRVHYVGYLAPRHDGRAHPQFKSEAGQQGAAGRRAPPPAGRRGAPVALVKSDTQVAVEQLSAMRVEEVEGLTVFDSSRARDRALTFRVGDKQVLAGFEEAVMRMSRGQIARVHVPFTKAYGTAGYPPVVPPECDLIYDIELIALLPGDQAAIK